MRPRALLVAGDPRDALLAAGLAVVLVIDSFLCPSGHALDGLGIAAVALECAPLAWRRAAPLAVLGLVIAGVFACLFTLKPTDVVVLPPMVAAFTVARTGDRSRSIVLGLVAVACALFAVMIASGELRDSIYNASLMALAVVAGDGVRSRHAYRVAAAERDREREDERERDAQRRVADERLRIAQEVHDVVAHAMVAINVQAGVAAHLIDGRPEQARSALTEIKRVSGSALSDLRATLGLLRAEDPGTVAPVRPAEALGQLPELAAPLRAAGITVALDVDPDLGELPTAVGAAAFRIVQEALTNVLRHAAAGSVRVGLQAAGERVVVVVQDDGAALAPVGASTATGDAAGENRAAARGVGAGEREPLPPGSGNGLRGMRERAAAIGGTVSAGPTPDGGWRVRAELPRP